MVAEAAVEQAEVNLQDEKDRYDNGPVTLSDRLEAEVLLHQAQDQRIEARREYWLERAAYLRTIGREDLASRAAHESVELSREGAADGE